jgi:hypothetical protein
MMAAERLTRWDVIHEQGLHFLPPRFAGAAHDSFAVRDSERARDSTEEFFGVGQCAGD